MAEPSSPPAPSEPSTRPIDRVVRPGPGLLVPDGPNHRRASDAVRLLLSVVLLVLVSVVTRTRGDLEGAFGEFVTSTPAWLTAIARSVYSGGTVLVVIGLALLALIPRRWRLVGTIVVATVIATVTVFVLHAWLDAGSAVPEQLEQLRSYPLRRLSVAVAVYFAVRGYLVRPVRLLFDVLVAFTALGAAGVPAGLPLDVVAGFLVGWGSAAATSLLLGSPAGRPPPVEVRAVLAELGVDVVQVELSARQVWGDVRYDAVDADGRHLEVVVLGRDADDAQLLAKTWRTLWYRDSGPLVTFSRQHRVEQMAYMLMLARQRGAMVPEVVVAGVAGASNTAALVTRRPAGTALEDLAGDEVSDASLRSLWRTLLALRGARLAHGGLESHRLLVEGDTAVVVDFSDASTSAPAVRLDADLAELLVVTTAAVGEDRAVRALLAETGEADRLSILPVLQPAALSASVRRQVPDLKELLGSLRGRLAEQTGAEPPAPAELRRVTVGNVVTLALGFVAVFFVLSMLSELDFAELWESVRTASWGWVAVAVVLSAIPLFTDALGTMGAIGTQLPLAPMVVMNAANKFIGIAMPSAAGRAAVSIRFAQRQGLEPGAAIMGGIVVSLAGFLMELTIIVTGLSVGVVDLDLDFSVSLSADRIGWWVLGIAAVVVALVFAVRSSIRLRRLYEESIRPQIAQFRAGGRAIVDEPRRIVLLVVGNAGSQLVLGLMLTVSLLAFGADRDVFLLALLANTGASLLGGLMPIPGGIGVWEGAATALLVAGGVDPPVAAAAVVVHRMITYYLPPLYGWFALQWLRRRDYL